MKTCIIAIVIVVGLEVIKHLAGMPVAASIGMLILGFCFGRMYEAGDDEAALSPQGDRHD